MAATEGRTEPDAVELAEMAADAARGADGTDANGGASSSKKVRRWYREVLAITTFSGLLHVPVWVTTNSAAAAANAAAASAEAQTRSAAAAAATISAAEMAVHADGMNRIKTDGSGEAEGDMERFFECTLEGCGRRFLSRENLRKHMRTHSPKDFVCTVCRKSFNTSAKLKRHVMVHTGEKPFACPWEGNSSKRGRKKRGDGGRGWWVVVGWVVVGGTSKACN